ncbi:diguanylate cyclase [Bacillus sp. BGMRC 2118]|nr:diguanylate cyclase [Bacillus sp. BGMRC 2118]
MLNLLKSLLISFRGRLLAGLTVCVMLITHLNMLHDTFFAHIILNEWIGLVFRVLIIFSFGFFIDYIYKIKMENVGNKEVYSSLFEHNLDASYSLNLTGHFKEVNQATSRITGYSREELVNASFLPLIADEDKSRVFSYFKQVLNGESVLLNATILHKSGERRTLNLMAVPIYVDHHIVGCIGIGRDITEELAKERELKESEERYRSLMKLQPEMMCVVSVDGIEFINQKGIEFLGLTSHREALGKHPLQFVEAGDQELFTSNFTKLLQGTKIDSLQEYQFINSQGESRVGEVSSTKIMFNGKPSVLGIVRDITEKRQAEEKLILANQLLETLSAKDGLTNVYNRRYLEQKYQEEWVACAEIDAPLSLIMLDIDCFKLYNDTYGHIAGDQCLISVSGEIEKLLAYESYTFARYGGEEFTVLLPNTKNDEAVIIAEKVRECVQSLNMEHQTSLVEPFVTISVGVATVCPAQESCAKRLIEEADQALYASKKNGKNQVTSFEECKVFLS